MSDIKPGIAARAAAVAATEDLFLLFSDLLVVQLEVPIETDTDDDLTRSSGVAELPKMTNAQSAQRLFVSAAANDDQQAEACLAGADEQCLSAVCSAMLSRCIGAKNHIACC